MACDATRLEPLLLLSLVGVDGGHGDGSCGDGSCGDGSCGDGSCGDGGCSVTCLVRKWQLVVMSHISKQKNWIKWKLKHMHKNCACIAYECAGTFVHSQ